MSYIWFYKDESKTALCKIEDLKNIEHKIKIFSFKKDLPLVFHDPEGYDHILTYDRVLENKYLQEREHALRAPNSLEFVKRIVFHVDLVYRMCLCPYFRLNRLKLLKMHG